MAVPRKRRIKEAAKHTKHAQHYENISFGFVPFVGSIYYLLGKSALRILMALASLEIEQYEAQRSRNGLNPLPDESARSRFRALCFRQSSSCLGHQSSSCLVTGPCQSHREKTSCYAVAPTSSPAAQCTIGTKSPWPALPSSFHSFPPNLSLPPFPRVDCPSFLFLSIFIRPFPSLHIPSVQLFASARTCIRTAMISGQM